MTSSAPPAEQAHVAVFAKAPVPGTVKTRLVPLLGAQGAARLHERLVRRALATAAASRVGPVELWCAPDEDHAFFAACAKEFSATLLRQRGADLGDRMAAAFEHAFAAGRRLVLVGSDCPALDANMMRAAASALRDHDAAIAPAEDGGYVLIALARPVAGLFDGVAWSTGQVMEQTRGRLRASRAQWTELPMAWDIDRPEDYARLRREGYPEALP